VSLPSVLTIFIALLLEPLVAASVSLLERSTTVTQDVGIVAVTGVTYLGAVALCVIKASSLFYPSRGAVVTYVPDVCIVPRIVGDQNQTLIRSCTWFLFGDGVRARTTDGAPPSPQSQLASQVARNSPMRDAAWMRMPSRTSPMTPSLPPRPACPMDSLLIIINADFVGASARLRATTSTT
jgi:hypothetical protein